MKSTGGKTHSMITDECEEQDPESLNAKSRTWRRQFLRVYHEKEHMQVALSPQGPSLWHVGPGLKEACRTLVAPPHIMPFMINIRNVAK